MNRIALIAGISILVAAGAASGGELPGSAQKAIIEPAADLTIATGLPPKTYLGALCSNPKEWPNPPSPPYIYRYCSNRQTPGYEAQRDDWYKSIRDRYLGSQLLDCDSNEGWLPPSQAADIKRYYCP